MVKITYSPASFLSRLIALGADTFFIVSFAFMVSFFFPAPWKDLIFLSLTIFYKPALEYYWGQTLGKKLMGIKVVGPQGGRPSLDKIILRNCFPLLQRALALSLTLYLWGEDWGEALNMAQSKLYFSARMTLLALYGFSSLLVLFKPKGQAAHDILAGTYVVELS